MPPFLWIVFLSFPLNSAFSGVLSYLPWNVYFPATLDVSAQEWRALYSPGKFLPLLDTGKAFQHLPAGQPLAWDILVHCDSNWLWFWAFSIILLTIWMTRFISSVHSEEMFDNNVSWCLIQWNVSSVLPSDYCSKATKPSCAPVILCPISSHCHNVGGVYFFGSKTTTTIADVLLPCLAF